MIPPTGNPCDFTRCSNAAASCTVDTIGAITHALAPAASAACAIAVN